MASGLLDGRYDDSLPLRAELLRELMHQKGALILIVVIRSPRIE